VITVAGAGVGALARSRRQRDVAPAGPRWSSMQPLPNAGAAVPPVSGTRPEFTPLAQHYRIDINTAPPMIREDQWRLKVAGLVETPLEFSLEALRRYEPRHEFVTLACISNPIAGDLTSTTRWTGVSLQRLLPDLHLKPAATHLKIRSADGFSELLALEVIRAEPRVMLTYAWDGVPLLVDHGFPLRLYIPDRYGMKQPQWIDAIEAMDHAAPGYWVTRGWSPEALMRATSVLDTIAVDMMVITADQRTLMPLGGIAHAGARGISRVEVRVDEGPWQEASLRTPLSELTWLIWRYDWPFQRGEHTFTVRCYEGNGTPQITTQAPVRPDGATGLHSRHDRFWPTATGAPRRTSRAQRRLQPGSGNGGRRLTPFCPAADRLARYPVGRAPVVRPAAEPLHVSRLDSSESVVHCSATGAVQRYSPPVR
jgi:DMSO/TMAO reductase YedYZ molybdopterin-dependent catalytic subunit